jgi:hypothetical protein
MSKPKTKNPSKQAASRRDALPVLVIRIGRCLMDGESKLECFACSKEAEDWPWPDGPALKGYGLAEIQINQQGNQQVPICESCFNSGDVSDTVARKVLQAPDLEFTNGGEVGSIDEVHKIADAMAEQRATNNPATKH